MWYTTSDPSMRFSVNVSTLFVEAPLLARFALAAEAGFEAVECWWPQGLDPARFIDAVIRSNLKLNLLNLYGGDLVAGDRGVLSHPVRAQEFRDTLPLGLDIARATHCRQLHALVGFRDPGLTREDQIDLAVENVRWAADRAVVHGISILIEPINALDLGPYLLPDPVAAAKFIAVVDRANVRLQFDTYHTVRAGHPLEETLRAHAGLLGHIQIADAPGRGAPGTGDIDFPGFFRALDGSGYNGFIGLEYLVHRTTEQDLAWLPAPLRCGEPTLASVLSALEPDVETEPIPN
jgi:hydroxypyruvate isomerase